MINVFSVQVVVVVGVEVVVVVEEDEANQEKTKKLVVKDKHKSVSCCVTLNDNVPNSTVSWAVKAILHSYAKCFILACAVLQVHKTY